ncbi:MAG TPA: hypothetical protein PLX35_07500 [Cyclobacteriaceae bacterium]|nr:hypothetical protein [Cyclobacteriaceae bacterium]
MRNLLLLSLIIAALTSRGQDKVTFRTYFKPNKVYKTTMVTSSETEVDFTGNQEKIEKIKARGVKLPMIVSGSNEMTTTTTTGAYRDDKSFPARMVYGKVTASQVVNGRESNEEKPASGLIVEGFYNSDNKFRIDTLISDRMDESTKKVIKSTVENVQQLIRFPENPMQVGDTFEQNLPMQIPIAGLNPVKVLINTSYKLKEIQHGKATFDIIQTVTLDMSNGQANISASGEGTGISEFDMVNNAITRYESDLTMTMKMTVDDLIVSAKINSKSKSKQMVTTE